MANGIPSLLGKVAKVGNTASLLISDAQIVLNMFGPVRWGVFLNGSLAITPDSIIGVEYKRDWRVPDYPMEGGSFQNYNKVATPADARVTMTRGGTESERQIFLEAVDVAASSLNLYDVVTPEKTFVGYNITHYDFRRVAMNGASLITIDLWLQEIRVTATTQYSNTQQPSGTDPVNTGIVQTTSPPAGFGQNIKWN
jgi:hypothetical protein